MTAKTIYWLPKFDPNAAFVVAAWPLGYTISGYQPKPGEPFDKTSIKSARVLEELYVKRWIAVAENLPREVNIAEVDTSSDFIVQAKRGRGRPRKNAAA